MSISNNGKVLRQSDVIRVYEQTPDKKGDCYWSRFNGNNVHISWTRPYGTNGTNFEMSLSPAQLAELAVFVRGIVTDEDYITAGMVQCEVCGEWGIRFDTIKHTDDLCFK